MRRAFGFALVMTFVACGWVPYQPGSRIPFDARLGQQVTAGDPLIAVQVNAGAVGPSKLFVNVVQGRGRKSDLTTLQAPKTEVFELDGANVRKLPDPPLDPTRPAVFATTWSPNVTLLRGDDDVLALWNGTSWSVLPAPPGDSSGVMLVADERHVLIDRNDAFAAFDGTSWVRADRRGQLGPIDASGVRLVFADERGLCTELLSWTTLQAQGPASCTANASNGPTEPSLNGRVDDFQVIADGALFHFSNGVWQRGVAVPASNALLPAPGSLAAPLRQAPAGPFPSHLLARGGVIAGLLSPQMNVALDCACKRSDDPGCGCVPLEVPSPLFFFLNDGSGLVSVTVPTVDARRAVFARTLALPLETSPWGPVCQKACGAGERCEISVGTQGFVSEVCVSNDPMSNLPRATLIATVRSANPGTVAVSFASPDGGPLDARVVTGAPSLVLEGPPLADVTLTLSQPGHAPRVLSVRFPDASRTADLGAVPLLGARFLSREPIEAAQGLGVPVNSASALIVPHTETDAGVTWLAVRSATDGGLSSTPLAPGRTLFVSPLWLPRQHRLLVFGPSSLAAFDDVTLEPRGTVAGTFVADPSASSLGAVAFVSGTHLLRFDAQGITTLASVSGAATRALLSADGGVGLRGSGMSWQAVFSDGTTRALPNLTSPNPTLEASGRAAFFSRNGSLVEIALATGAEQTLATGAFSLAPGLRSDRLVAAGSVQDGGVFVPFCDLYASGARQGPFVDGVAGRAAPGGAWVSSENADLVVRTVDDGVSRDTMSGIDWRILALSDEGFATLPSDQSRATEIRYFHDGLRTATLAKATVGAPFGASDARLISARRLYRYAPSTGALSDEWRIIDDDTSYTLDPTFVSLASASSFATRPLGSSRGMPCALFTTPHLTWSVANDGTVTRREEGVDLFCAP
jgi:hypothetical protein